MSYAWAAPIRALFIFVLVQNSSCFAAVKVAPDSTGKNAAATRGASKGGERTSQPALIQVDEEGKRPFLKEELLGDGISKTLHRAVGENTGRKLSHGAKDRPGSEERVEDRLDEKRTGIGIVADSMRSRDIPLLGAGFALGVCVTLVSMNFVSRYHGHGEKRVSRPVAEEADKETQQPPARISSGDLEYNESLDLFWPRTSVLIVMLMVQSLSSTVLRAYHQLIADHPELVYFLTMLVGLGGNASGQSVVLAVREIALGQEVSYKRQILVGIGMGICLAPFAYSRAILSEHKGFGIGAVIALSSVLITVAGTTLGTAMPLLAKSLDFDPGHMSPVVQVLMDMIGICIVCTVGTLLLDVL